MEPQIKSMNFNTTDARPNNALKNFGQLQRATINIKVLEQIESDLEEFEKIAILFLLAAEYPAPYSTVIGFCRNIKDRPYIIAEYIKNNLELWCDKLVEALCIIGNYEVLQNLGYPDPLEVCNRYHARIPRYTVKINVAAKVLYKLFESLTSEQSKLLLQLVYEDGRIVKTLEDTQYLELHALYWLQEGFIIISPDGTVNFINLLKYLKRLNLYSESIYHDVEHFCMNRALDAPRSCVQGKPILDEQSKPTLSNDVQIKVQKNTQIIKKGLCLIINEVFFPDPYKRRDGSDSDRDNLRKTFSRRNFDILIEESLSKDKMKKKLREVSDKFDDKEHDCLVVCILSHGYKGGIVTCDGCEIPIKEIEDEVCTLKLRNIIKLLIVQACQGKSIGDVSEMSDLATDGLRELNFGTDNSRKCDLSIDGPSENILRYKHYCQFMSTMDRFVSIRHKKLGSWFIEAVCQVLSTSEDIVSLSEWSQDVIANVQRREGHVDGLETASQLPEFKSRLGMTVYFPPRVDNEATEVTAT